MGAGRGKGGGGSFGVQEGKWISRDKIYYFEVSLTIPSVVVTLASLVSSRKKNGETVIEDLSTVSI